MACPTSHFLLIPVPVWSHTKRLCALAVRIVTQAEGAVVTIITTSTLLEKGQLDIANQFNDSQVSTRLRIRLLSIADSSGPNVTATLELIAQNYPATYEALVQGKPIACLTSGVVFDAAPPLSAVIMDFYCKPQLKATQAITGTSVPIIAWVVTGIPAFLRNFGPESIGGIGDKTQEIQAEAARSGRNVWEIGQEVYGQCIGSIVNVPGVPPMYDHELHPQKVSSAMLVASHEAYGKETMDALKEWYSDQGKPVYLVGPTLYDPPKSSGATSNLEVASYLDKILEQRGRTSVVYISFGTVYWPTVPEYLDEIIEALLEKDFPFILTLSGPHARLEPDLKEKIEASGQNFICQWAPQEFILDHPLTATPSSICWPFTGDQPQGAAYVVDKLEAGFELFEVRTGLGLQSSYRSGHTPRAAREAVGEEFRRILDACRSEKGKRARQNALNMKEKFRAAWEENGAATIALRDFLQRFAKV
ncbi:hypothetical protein H0H92_002821 [Tricholoma furcatifolium]|nr:hypothetical protein H0H92_002821 [Tricholoma furcatifolium]